MRRLHLTCFCGDAALAVFAEVAGLLFHGLRRAGAQVEWAPRSMRRGTLNLVVAAHRMPPTLLPQLLDERVIFISNRSVLPRRGIEPMWRPIVPFCRARR